MESLRQEACDGEGTKLFQDLGEGLRQQTHKRMECASTSFGGPALEFSGIGWGISMCPDFKIF